jgi:acetyl esterase/lipase
VFGGRENEEIKLMGNGRPILLIAGTLMLVHAVAGAQARVKKNVVVGMYSGLALVMDVHHPDTPNGYGIVHISGSGWRRPLAYSAPILSESGQMDMFGQPLVERGYTVFSLNHRATPRFQFPAPLEDVQRAVRFVRYHADEYGIDPDRLGAVGGSSGGHLVSMLGVLDGRGDPDDADPVNQVSAKVQTVVARAAPADLARMGDGAEIALLLGAQVPENLESEEGHRYLEASPINHVSPDDPPILLLHGDADETVPFEQAELMVDALKAAGVESRLIRIPGGGHGPAFTGAQNPPDYISAMVEWFDRYLRK